MSKEPERPAGLPEAFAWDAGARAWICALPNDDEVRVWHDPDDGWGVDTASPQWLATGPTWRACFDWLISAERVLVSRVDALRALLGEPAPEEFAGHTPALAPAVLEDAIVVEPEPETPEVEREKSLCREWQDRAEKAEAAVNVLRDAVKSAPWGTRERVDPPEFVSLTIDATTANALLAAAKAVRS